MKKIKKIINYITHPKETLVYMMNKNFFFFIPDKIYLKWKYKLIIGKKLDLDNPKLLSEKLQWLKLYNRKNIYTQMVDKYEARDYIKNRVDEKYLIPVIGVYDNFDDINFDKLPSKFVMKCTHDSGGLVICKNKNNLNIAAARKKINKCLKRKYFYVHREWPYKNVKPRIVIEKLLENKNKEDLIEYNFFCFDGKPKIISVCHGDKEKNRYNDFYDINFKKLQLKCIYNTSDKIFEKPNKLKEMINIAVLLSKDIPCLRVDLYLCNNKIYVGELTFSHFAGFTQFEPQKYETILGNYIKIKDLNNEKK